MGASNNFGIGGIFYSDPPGLYIDRDSGDIITASSTVGDYDVYYSRDPDFGTWSRIGADINAVVGSKGFIENNNRNGISVRLNAAGNVLITLSPSSNEYAQMISPWKKELHMLSLGGTIATGPKGVIGEVIYGNTYEDLKEIQSKVINKLRRNKNYFS